MTPAIFFTSYARLDNNKYTKLGEAIEELRERVRGLLGSADAQKVGFFDLEEIKSGADWVDRLGEAVAKCRMFVCFCSNTYFNRDVCGKEFEAFRRRLAAAAPAGRYIFPVIWDKCVLPQAVQLFQADNKKLPREYFDDGLLSLRRVRRDAEYETAIEALARGIADAITDPELPDGLHPIDFAALPSAFDNPGADAVRISVLADAGMLWEAMPGRTARAAIEEATAKFQVSWRQLENGLELPRKLKASAAERQPVVLITPDPSAVWRLRLADIDDALADEQGPPCAVLVGRQKGSAATPNVPDDELVRALFPKSLARLEHQSVFDERNPAQLVERLRIAIDRLRAGALASGQVAPVRDVALEAAARDAGVPIVRPVLSGPGQS